MRQTLLYVPHELYGLPVFGIGWLLFTWMIFSVIVLVWLFRRDGFGGETRGSLPVLIVIAAVIAFLLPHLEVRAPDGVVLGLPLRGFGLMLLLGVVSGVATAVYLARRVGLDPDAVYSLAFWMFVGGIVGARFFYAVQYWPEFRHQDLRTIVLEIVKFTEGGIVVYGSLLGALTAFVIFTRVQKLPTLAYADIIAPAMVLGLSIGRWGCLFNGCCYGGTAPEATFAISFPRYNSVQQRTLSPPYMHQLGTGQLHGVRIGERGPDGTLAITYVEPNSPAADAGLQQGVAIRSLNGHRVNNRNDVRAVLARSGPDITLGSTQGETYRWSLEVFPEHSLPVHPTQVYSSLNALFLFLFLWFYFPFRTRDGQVFAWLMTCYPLTRFLLEMIRDDEGGQLGTSFTISQICSILAIALVIAFWCYLARKPRQYRLVTG